MSKWIECPWDEAERYRCRFREEGTPFVPWSAVMESERSKPLDHASYLYEYQKLVEAPSPPEGHRILGEDEEPQNGDMWQLHGYGWIGYEGQDDIVKLKEIGWFARKVEPAVDPGEGYELCSRESAEEYLVHPDAMWWSIAEQNLPPIEGCTYRRRIKPEHRKEYAIIEHEHDWRVDIPGSPMLCGLEGCKDPDGRTFTGYRHKGIDGVQADAVVMYTKFNGFDMDTTPRMATHAVFEFIDQGEETE